MQSYDNKGKLQSEINTIYTSDGRVIITTTTYDTYHAGRVALSECRGARFEDEQGLV
jgi:hypothetical protein